MIQTITSLSYYCIPLLVIFVGYILYQKFIHHRSLKVFNEAQESGLTEPASLHPVIDPDKCLGCGSCVTACPEHHVLGIINKKASLIAPASCIGHGVCKTACPFDAITLVFGTETRGVDIPNVNEQFETNVPGVFVAGELGGMGLIRNAVQQGVEAVEAAHSKYLGQPHSFSHDIIVIGAGPAGLSAGLAALEKKAKYLILEQDSIGGAIAHYPRGKLVMTKPATLPIVGAFKFKEVTKEKLMAFWINTVNNSRLKIHTGHRVESINPLNHGFDVHTNKGRYQARAVILCIGRRGSPQKLGIPGEELSKVTYRLVSSEQYRGKKVIVVGGGDSAIEAAVTLADEPGTDVTLSYRGEAFSRVKKKNRERVQVAQQAGKVNVLMQSNLTEITRNRVAIDTSTGPDLMENDAVIICAGSILPTRFLQAAGIETETKFGTA